MPDQTPAVDLAARVHQTLVDLGEWPNTVAKALAKAGARGRRNSAISETTKQRGSCSNSNCACRRYAAEEVADRG